LHLFNCYPTKSAPARPDLRSAHLLGADGLPVRGELKYSDGAVRCESRSQEALALSLLWPVRGAGLLQLETTRLPARSEPYNLHVELARHRLMRISLKREEWGLYEYPGLDEIAAEIDEAQARFIAALQAADDPAASAQLADESLALSIAASEHLADFHASIFLTRRQNASGFNGRFLGVFAEPGKDADLIGPALRKTFDFVRVPFVWREIQATEEAAEFAAVDGLVERCAKLDFGVRGGPLLNFGIRFLPDWLYLWENDYEAVAGFAREHIRKTVKRYANKVSGWVIASGLHAENVFPFTFEQIMDLTRMAAGTVRQIAPRGQVILEITQPWGEYYARNQRTIPPHLYAEMAIQSGISFDTFGLQLHFGLDAEGYHARDVFQVSTMIDRLAASHGKPIHLGLAAPAAPVAGAGFWRQEWDPQRQAEWLRTVAEIALSKPYVESVCIDALVDSDALVVPGSGVYSAEREPKPAVAALGELRGQLGKAG